MLAYKFLINNIEVEEPTSWDGEEFILSRSKEYFGFENSYSLSLKFWNLGASIIKSAYEEQGIEAMLDFVVSKSCDGVTYTPIIQGILNCANFSELNGEVSVLLEESSFARTFKNRIDNIVNLHETKTIDGQTVSDIQPIDVTLQPKAIIQRTRLVANSEPSVLNITTERFTAGQDLVFYPALVVDLENSDLKEPNTPAPTYETCGDTGAFDCPKKHIYQNTLGFTIDVTIRVRLKGYIAVHTYINGTSPAGLAAKLDNTGFFISIGAGNILLSDVLQDGYCLAPESDTTSRLGEGYEYYDIDTTYNALIQNGGKVSIWHQIGTISTEFSPCGSGDQSPDVFFRVEFDPISFVEFTSVTVSPQTSAKVFPLFSAFKKSLEIITGVSDAFRSDFFGNGGCGDHISITNGLAIRNMLQADKTPFPVNVSFAKLYKAFDSILCLGMNIEWDATASKWVVRVEPRGYFCKKNYQIVFNNVSDITIKSSLDHYYSEVSIGYQKWQMNNGQINGIDEFNTPRGYTIRNKNAKKKLDAKCEFIAGGYPIEFTRRQQYLDATTKDFETDNDIFVICLNRVVQGSYAVGTTNERNELFPNVVNLISPETSYNLRISPARNMSRWLRYVKISTTKQDKFIKFSTSEGNSLMKTTSINSCDGSIEIDEHANFETGKNGFSQSNNELFQPQTISFEKPLDFATFAMLQGNSKNPVRINTKCNKVFLAFLESVKFKPNGKDGGSAEFEFTTAPIGGGSFSDGFSDGFDNL